MPSDYTRGVLTTLTGEIGYIQSIDAKAGATEDTIKSAAGVTVSVAFVDNTNEVTVVAKFDRGATLPAIGASVTIAAAPTIFNGLYYVMDCQFKEQNTTSCEVTLALKRYVTGSLPAA